MVPQMVIKELQNITLSQIGAFVDVLHKCLPSITLVITRGPATSKVSVTLMEDAPFDIFAKKTNLPVESAGKSWSISI